MTAAMPSAWNCWTARCGRLEQSHTCCIRQVLKKRGSRLRRAGTWRSSRKGNTEIRVDIAELPERLPREVELALFRVLQEGLANIHRHAKSRSAEVEFRLEGAQLALEIRDHGVGIAPEMLEQFRSAAVFGVGLAGI